MYQVPFKNHLDFVQKANSPETIERVKSLSSTLQMADNEWLYLNCIVHNDFIEAAKNNQIDYTKIRIEHRTEMSYGFESTFLVLCYENLELKITELSFTYEGKINFDSL